MTVPRSAAPSAAPLVTSLRSRLLVASAATAAAMLGCLAPSGYAQPEPGLRGASVRPAQEPSRAHLVCQVHTIPGDPLTLVPPLTGVTRPVQVGGTLELDHCSSPDKSLGHLSSGRLEFRGRGVASCAVANDLRGTGALTWYASPGRRGRTVSTSVLHPASRTVGAKLPDALLTGTVASGPLTGRHYQASVTKPGDTHRCLTQGLARIVADGRMSFS
ncbi:hypothetical protein ACFP1Z_10310 [Streptomyces gamaensis]|uniref:Ig-like domain-containing protein n=1 Tax=Streptomyces gamaensis TaxID=1763542 RepID=A0ABW0YY38_9ACTN